MTKLFTGGAGGKTPQPQTPRVVRLPTQDDPSVLAAAQRTRRNALNRTGRRSTILTDQTKSTTGSSGQKLGA